MRTGTISRVGPYKVEQISGCIRTHSPVDLSKPPTVGLHTTEGGWDSSISVFRSRLTTPIFLVGNKRLGQCAPLGEMGAAFENDPGGVETNRWCRVQIEIVEFSEQKCWLPDDGTLDVLVHLLAWIADNCGVPMKRAWDGCDLGPTPWATEDFPRRHANKWGNFAGVFGHVEIPENAHWDPGELDYPKLFAKVRDVGVKRARTLRLTSPAMKGDDVRRAKKLLEENPFGDFHVGNRDELWGMEAAQATFRAKHFLGYPWDARDPNFGPTLREYLAGDRKLPADYRARRLKRIAKFGFKSPTLSADRSVH